MGYPGFGLCFPMGSQWLVHDVLLTSWVTNIKMNITDTMITLWLEYKTNPGKVSPKIIEFCLTQGNESVTQLHCVVCKINLNILCKL